MPLIFFLAEKFIKDANARLEELQPAVDEYNELQAALGKIKAEEAKTEPERLPLRVRKAQVLELVKGRPGIRVTNLADELGLTVPRVVQVVNDLEQEGSLTRGNSGLKLSTN